MKILITGGSGLLGQYLNLQLSESNEIITLYNDNAGNCRNFKSAKVDLTDFAKTEEVISSFKPEIIIHTAAVSSPQKASELPSKTVYKINVNATKNLAQLCEKHKSRLIFTSTDLVYAGYRGSMLKEDAKLIPVSLYAETKLMGEQKITETFENYIILRTALLCGFGLHQSKNHFHEMYRKLKKGEKVKLFTDQYRTPLALPDASRMIEQLCKLDIKNEIMNFGGKERLSRAELGEKLCDAAELDKSLIEKISMNDLANFPHVADVSMNTDKLQSYGIIPKSIDESLNLVLRFEY